MSLMSVCWTLFKSVSIWGSFDLDYILQKGISCLNISIITEILEWKIYRISFYIANSSIDIELERTGEVTVGAYLVCYQSCE